MKRNQDSHNIINLKNPIAVSNIHWDSDGIPHTNCFKLIFSCMIVTVKQYVPKDDSKQGMIYHYIASVRRKAINSMKWWRRLFPTPLTVTGLFINCYIPQHRKNGC